MTVGGVDTYYDYDEKQWKSRRLGGGPIRRDPVCPLPRTTSQEQCGSNAGASSHVETSRTKNAAARATT
jgi:hypothetical protein